MCLMLFSSGKTTSVERIRELVQSIGLVPVSLEDAIQTGFSLKDRLTRLVKESDLVIADLTGHSLNVMLELGICLGLNKKVILIAQERTAIPFNLRGVRTIEYATTNHGIRKLEMVLRKELLRSQGPQLPLGLDYFRPGTSSVGGFVHGVQRLIAFLQEVFSLRLCLLGLLTFLV